MKQRILIVGTGFAGLWSALSAARQLDLQARDDIEICVVAPQAQLHVRPRFYEADVARMRAPLDALFAVVGVRFVKGWVTGIDSEGQTLTYRDADQNEHSVSYSRLILASGSQVNRPALSGVEHAFDVDSLEQAEALERHLTGLRDLPDSPARNTVVVAGGGFTGIETATEMPARLRAILGEQAHVRVIVVDRGAQIGASLGAQVAPVVAEASAQQGVTWRLGSSVSAVDAGGVTLADGERIDALTVIWTVGVHASPLTAQLPAQRDAHGRLHVDRNLKVVGLDNLYAAGDTAFAATDDLGNHALMTCQHAIALGRSAGNNAAADLLGVAPIAYSQPKYVTCLDLGEWGALYTEGWDRQVVLTGAEGKQLKTQINTGWIYPPAAVRETALAAADPLIPVVA
ncbi:NAD(P)/FAD-dependent oxidoreductase [Pseudomonas seleniipraecipitans]|uniref:NAD(P)/FAD-dependent oxidoreductase n=1 Tax=Phytopseudomonas seleniipraecipitans TaxID=640205 RepID=A0ABY5JBM2_9GAMM|nr:NAD(P)/FAD-dependent oxidoreductase [Pseudomonas seleniipraecipitans]UUD65045.1 NAD(P)/FAD-dependent oxidoreductase [Pseudomonas seleniipraecipitans]